MASEGFRRSAEPAFAPNKPLAAKPVPAAVKPRQRMPLRANRRRLSYDLRLRLWLFALAVPTIAATSLLVWRLS